MDPSPKTPSETNNNQMNEELQKFYQQARKKTTKKMTPLMSFSPATAILKDLKNKRTFDIIKVKQAIDQKPFCFDFGSGTILVFRYQVECVDAELMLYVPAIKSFQKKIQVGKFYEIASKRNFHYEMYDEGVNEWIIYVNRIKNISQVEMNIKDRMAWKLSVKSKEIKFGFDENWLEKSLPIDNNLDNLEKFMESPRDINRNSMLSSPMKVLRLEYQQQIEITEMSGSIIKNLEYLALLHNKKVIRLYVPYFLKDIVSNLIEKLLNMNLVINRLKLFNRKQYMGFLWDCTLSGFIFRDKLYEDKLLSIKDGEEFFENTEGDDFIKFLSRKKEGKRKFSPEKRRPRRRDWKEEGHRRRDWKEEDHRRSDQKRRRNGGKKKYKKYEEPMVYRRKDKMPESKD
jgi:hypothetical protein